MRRRASSLLTLMNTSHTIEPERDYDMTRIALQTWAEAPRDRVLQARARELYLDTLDHIGELADRWRDHRHVPRDADTKAVAATLFSLMHGLIVMHHVVEDVSADALRTGLALLGAAVA